MVRFAVSTLIGVGAKRLLIFSNWTGVGRAGRDVFGFVTPELADTIRTTAIFRKPKAFTGATSGLLFDVWN